MSDVGADFEESAMGKERDFRIIRIYFPSFILYLPRSPIICFGVDLNNMHMGYIVC